MEIAGMFPQIRGHSNICLLHFVAFFPCSLTVFHRGDNEKVEVDNEKAGQQNNFFTFKPDFNIEISPKNATNHPVA